MLRAFKGWIIWRYPLQHMCEYVDFRRHLWFHKLVAHLVSQAQSAQVPPAQRSDAQDREYKTSWLAFNGILCGKSASLISLIKYVHETMAMTDVTKRYKKGSHPFIHHIHIYSSISAQLHWSAWLSWIGLFSYPSNPLHLNLPGANFKMQRWDAVMWYVDICNWYVVYG